GEGAHRGRLEVEVGRGETGQQLLGDVAGIDVDRPVDVGRGDPLAGLRLLVELVQARAAGVVVPYEAGRCAHVDVLDDAHARTPSVCGADRTERNAAAIRSWLVTKVPAAAWAWRASKTSSTSSTSAAASASGASRPSA